MVADHRQGRGPDQAPRVSGRAAEGRLADYALGPEPRQRNQGQDGEAAGGGGGGGEQARASQGSQQHQRCARSKPGADGEGQGQRQSEEHAQAGAGGAPARRPQRAGDGEGQRAAQVQPEVVRRGEGAQRAAHALGLNSLDVENDLADCQRGHDGGRAQERHQQGTEGTRAGAEGDDKVVEQQRLEQQRAQRAQAQADVFRGQEREQGSEQQEGDPAIEAGGPRRHVTADEGARGNAKRRQQERHLGQRERQAAQVTRLEVGGQGGEDGGQAQARLPAGGRAEQHGGEQGERGRGERVGQERGGDRQCGGDLP